MFTSSKFYILVYKVTKNIYWWTEVVNTALFYNNMEYIYVKKLCTIDNKTMFHIVTRHARVNIIMSNSINSDDIIKGALVGGKYTALA